MPKTGKYRLHFDLAPLPAVTNNATSRNHDPFS